MTTRTPRTFLWLFWTLAVTGFVLDQTGKYSVFAWLRPEPRADRPTAVEIAQFNGRGGEVELLPGKFRLSTRFLETQDPGEGVLGFLRTLSGNTLPYVNKGALFGMGWDANGPFAVVSFIAAVAIIGWSTRPTALRDRFLSVALGLILGGTFGNLYDRLVFGGVRDYLHWYYLVDWPVFNLADCCLVCGAGLLLLQAFGSGAEKASSRQLAPEMAAIPEVAETR